MEKAWRDFSRNNPESSIHFVSFEDLKKNTKAEISKIAEFLDLHETKIKEVLKYLIYII